MLAVRPTVCSVGAYVWERWLGPRWELQGLKTRQAARAAGHGEDIDEDTNLEDLWRLKSLQGTAQGEALAAELAAADQSLRPASQWDAPSSGPLQAGEQQAQAPQAPAHRGLQLHLGAEPRPSSGRDGAGRQGQTQHGERGEQL